MSTTRFSRALAAALAIVLALGLSWGCAKRSPGERAGNAGAVGSIAPAYALPDLDGKIVKNSDFLGKVVILDFWATWCPPCVRGVPELVQLQSKYRDQGLEIVGLSLDEGGAKDVRPFVEQHQVNYTMLIANDGTADSYGGITGIPTTFIVDKSGTIVKRFMGYTDPVVIEEAIQPLIAAN